MFYRVYFYSGGDIEADVGSLEKELREFAEYSAENDWWPDISEILLTDGDKFEKMLDSKAVDYAAGYLQDMTEYYARQV